MDLTNYEIRVVRAAAVQMAAKLGETRANLDHAGTLVEQAAQKGAQVVVLPELAACGYSMSPLLWDAAETKEGITVAWARATSRRLAIYLGIGFIEADGEDFFNAYVLCQPDGQVAGIVRKTMAETVIFKCASGQPAIQSSLGKIGIGICADNQYAPHVRRMQEQSIDLLLMPHAWPGAYKVGGLVSQADVRETHQKACEMATLYTQLLGVPAVFVNHVGPRGPEKWSGLLGGLMKPEAFRFLGHSTIADADGTILRQMDDCEEGVIVADVTLDPARKIYAEPPHYGSYGGGWIKPHSPVLDALCHIDAFGGRLSYSRSGERKRKAHQISGS